MTILMLWFYVLSIVSCFFKVVDSEVDYKVYIKPDGSRECPGEPCFSLGYFTEGFESQIFSNTTCVFLPGTHTLHRNLKLENLTNVEFNGYSSASEVIVSPFANIMLIGCENITIANLAFVFSGNNDSKSFSSALFFRGCNDVDVTATSFKGDGSSTYSIALRGHTSSIAINNCTFSDCSHSFGGGLTTYLCHIYMTNTRFFNNIATISGGAIFTYDGVLEASGNTFINNSAQISGGVIYCFHSRIIITEHNTFHNNSVSIDGGAMSCDHCIVEIRGENYFVGNRAAYLGGAISIFKNTLLSIRGDAKFYNNFAGWSGGALISFNSRSELIGNISIVSNAANVSGGGGIEVTHNSSLIGIDIYFYNNTVFLLQGSGGAISCNIVSRLQLYSVKFEGNIAASGGAVSVSSNSDADIHNISVYHSHAKIKGGGIVIDLHSNMTLSGENYFINNSVELAAGGALSVSQSHVHIRGSNYFINNSADLGGVASIFLFSRANISGELSLLNNHARLGGVLIIWVQSSVEFQPWSESYFINNSAEQGGAMFVLDSSISMAGVHRYIHNSANQGGVMTLLGKSKLSLKQNLEAVFESNRAEHVGGVIYFDDPISTTECNRTIINKFLLPTFCPDPTSPGTFEKCSTNKECFFELDSQIPLNVTTLNDANMTLTFVNNSAALTGTVLYGGMLDGCRVYVGGGIVNDCGLRGGGEYSEDPISVFKSISVIDDHTSSISSAPLHVCLCSGETYDCDLRFSVEIVTGTEFVLSAVAVGHGNFTVPSDIRVDLDSNIHLDPAQTIQHTDITCTDIRYRLYSSEESVSFTIYPDGPCRDIGIARHEIQVKFLPCPEGFVLSGIECVCESRLQRYASGCNVEDSSITREQNSFWIAPYEQNESYEGLIIHPAGCPLDYCVTAPVNVTLDNADIQCDFSHSGTLCGSCKQNLSITLGRLHCLKCTNKYLSLILPFFLSGIILVMFLLLLQLTVAKGTINGLIFYANTVQMNNHVFFPPQQDNILTVFITWLNLDLGIETCFYDGMDVYIYMWLQYVFPFYVWFLIFVIIVFSRYSHAVSKMLGSNPVAVLSTLILLSYAKLLRTIIMSLSYTVLEYPNNTLEHVWLFDGQILYFQTPKHIALGVFAILVLIFLFMPYTILMLISHKLYAYSNKKIFSWMNKIMPFLDTYHAPFNQEHRYWTGLLLLTRCALFLTFALNVFGSASVNLIAITSVSAGLMVVAWIRGKLYLNIYNDILEASFLLNLCIFSATTYHVNEIGGNQAGLAYTSVGIAFATFIGILFFHIYMRLKDTTRWQTVSVKVNNILQSIHSKPANACEPKEIQNKGPLTISVTEIKMDHISQYTA